MDSTESAALVDHMAALRVVTERFVRALADVPPTARPSTFDDWSLGDLAAHLGAVHRWAAETVETGGRLRRDNCPQLLVPMDEWYCRSRDQLLATLEATDPDRGCWTHDPDDQTVRYWQRRQLHETLVHLWDARSAADPHAAALADIAPEICADGVDELFTVFPRRAPDDRPGLPGSLELNATDAGRTWTIDPRWTLHQGARTDAEATISRPAGALLLHSWRRPIALDGLDISGDPEVIEVFRTSPVVP